MENGFLTASDSLVWHDIVLVEVPFPWATLALLGVIIAITITLLKTRIRDVSPSVQELEASDREFPYLDTPYSDHSTYVRYLESVSARLWSEQRHLSFHELTDIPWWEEKLRALRSLEKSVYSWLPPDRETIEPLLTPRVWR